MPQRHLGENSWQGRGSSLCKGPEAGTKPGAFKEPRGGKWLEPSEQGGESGRWCLKGNEAIVQGLGGHEEDFNSA